PAVEADARRVMERLGQILDLGIFDENDASSLAAAVDGEFADLWGGTYAVTPVDEWTLLIRSNGPDELADTPDDIELTVGTWAVRNTRGTGVDDGFFDADGGVPGDFADPAAGPP